MQCASGSHGAADCRVPESCPNSTPEVEWQKRVQTANVAADMASQRLEQQESRDLETECARKSGDFGLYPLSSQAREKASELSVRPPPIHLLRTFGQFVHIHLHTFMYQVYSLYCQVAAFLNFDAVAHTGTIDRGSAQRSCSGG